MDTISDKHNATELSNGHNENIDQDPSELDHRSKPSEVQANALRNEMEVPASMQELHTEERPFRRSS